MWKYFVSGKVHLHCNVLVSCLLDTKNNLINKYYIYSSAAYLVINLVVSSISTVH